MKTKLFFFTSLLLLSIATATAQTKEKGFFVEMNGGYGEVKTAFVSSTVENPLLFHLGYARYAVLTPSIGYQINRHWAAGFKITMPQPYCLLFYMCEILPYADSHRNYIKR